MLERDSARDTIKNLAWADSRHVRHTTHRVYVVVTYRRKTDSAHTTGRFGMDNLRLEQFKELDVADVLEAEEIDKRQD